MDYPEISDSEAFLLGLVVGEYSSRQKPLWDYGFFDLLELRLRPFIPQFNNLRFVKLDYLPADAEEVSEGCYHSEKFGLLQVNVDGVFALQDDNSRKSLTDLIVELLESHDVDHSHLLKSVAMNSHREDRFSDGYQFGKFLGNLLTTQLAIQLRDAEMGSFTYAEVPIAKRLESSRNSIVDELLRCEVVKELQSVELILDADRKGWCESFDESALPDGRISPAATLQELEGTIHAIWLSVGVIFRHLQDSPRGVKEGEYPRGFFTRKATTLPALKAGLVIAQQDLHRAKPELTPDSIVFHLIPGIEAVVKDLWAPSETEVRVLDVLSEKLRSGNIDEVKLASIANSLYRTYRNAVVHEGHKLGEYVTTWGEAMYVYSAMRLILDLHKSLKH